MRFDAFTSNRPYAPAVIMDNVYTVKCMDKGHIRGPMAHNMSANLKKACVDIFDVNISSYPFADKMEGFGTRTWPNGKTYRGEWKVCDSATLPYCSEF